VEVTGHGFKDLGLVEKKFGAPPFANPDLDNVNDVLRKFYTFNLEEFVRPIDPRPTFAT
jgi:hypothetical protein